VCFAFFAGFRAGVFGGSFFGRADAWAFGRDAGGVGRGVVFAGCFAAVVVGVVAVGVVAVGVGAVGVGA
jgi:hypothetical protein